MEPAYSAAQMQKARGKRDKDVRQLEARLGRLPQFVKSGDGLAYTISIEPQRRSDLPVSLKSLKIIKLVVPQLYNLQPCRIELQGISGPEVEQLQNAFRIRCIANPELSLTAHINYLSQNMHAMAAASTQSDKPENIAPVGETQLPGRGRPKAVTGNVEATPRSHIITIPRPPELDVGVTTEILESDESYFSDSAEEEEDEGEDSGNAEGEQHERQSGTSQLHRGILMSFPHLEMHGIELLEIFSLSLEIRCDRCKTHMDVRNVKNNAKADAAGTRAESCRKCANAMRIGIAMTHR
jgi:hypothetical protein